MLICYVAAAAAKSLQSCPTLCNPIDGSPPGSAVPGIFQARVLEWVAITFSRYAMPNPQSYFCLLESYVTNTQVLEAKYVLFSRDIFPDSLMFI